ncbi:hypothetical protein [Campylobacter sp. JMF_03 NE3]|uniref:hypothetical protein n=1 Tax=Campylobacter sp. JMF_03 NE3 TaxID=2983831 RepID=UPI0022E99D10|nr:hypothetical protein [Campylobacter sp. JMF_03 NE3]MDA3053539.1 hypothetical protein [Campylobacter sp. JMF_03 NE3]
MQELTPEQIQSSFIAMIVSFFILIAFIMITNKIFAKIMLKFKVLKIKKIAKKTNLDGYVLKTDQKGIPVLLVSKNNPEDIFLI